MAAGRVHVPSGFYWQHPTPAKHVVSGWHGSFQPSGNHGRPIETGHLLHTG